jgi:hypothetical protein
MAARHPVHHIVDLQADRTSVSFVDELHDPDGTTIIHRCTAKISNGQISQESVTVEAKLRPTESRFERQSREAVTMTDKDPGPPKRS